MLNKKGYWILDNQNLSIYNNWTKQNVKYTIPLKNITKVTYNTKRMVVKLRKRKSSDCKFTIICELYDFATQNEILYEIDCAIKPIFEDGEDMMIYNSASSLHNILLLLYKPFTTGIISKIYLKFNLFYSIFLFW